MTVLTLKDAIPEGLLDTSARELHRVLDGPTLIELDGEEGPPLFVSCLLHGNEDSGLVAIQKVLRRWASRNLPRPLMILIGNVAAAKQGMRRLECQPDYNRVWPGCEEGRGSDEARIMAEVHKRVVAKGAYAAIDVHNNTGRNPHYAVICVENDEVMALAGLFASRAVLFRGIPGTQTASFTGLIPAITVECGQPGLEENAHAAAQLIEAALEFDTGGTSELPVGMTVFHTLARVRVKDDVALSRNPNAQWLVLEDGLDLHNFEPLQPGFTVGETNHARPFEAVDENENDVSDVFFQIEEGKARLNRTVFPAMLTTDERVIRQDCLCYLMEVLRA